MIRYSGIPSLIRNTYARKKVSIIKYHNPDPVTLDHHLKYISKRFTFITLDQLVSAIMTKNWSSIPPKSLIVTIDDGYRENLKLPDVFARYKITPTIYLCSQLVNTNRHFWWKAVNREVLDSIRHMPNEERLQYLEETCGYHPSREYPANERQALSHEEIALMRNVVDFQSHSLSHPILTACSDDESRKEIFQSKKDIEELLGTECKHFSYPNGDYTSREIRFLREAGYLSARTLDVGWNDFRTDPFALKITGVTDNASINLLAAQLSGITGYLRTVARGSLTGKQRPILTEKAARNTRQHPKANSEASR